jgi:hypothetical protein
MQMMVVTLVSDRFEETVAAYERLGFQRLLKGTPNGVLFQAGPALVEVVDGTRARPPTPPPAVPARALARSRT